MITFMHFRKYDQMGNASSRGGLTVAIDRKGDTVSVAMAKCGYKDNFNKKLGRTIAEGRLRSGSPSHIRLFSCPEDVDVKFAVTQQDFLQKEIDKLNIDK